MATNAPIIAKRYSAALWASVNDPTAAKVIAQELKESLDVLRDADLWRLLCSPTFNSADKIAVLNKVLEKGGASKQLSRFLEHLVEAGRINALAEIVEAFNQRVLDSEGVSVAEVETAAALTEKQKNDLSLALSKAFAKKVILKITENSQLVAGLRISVAGKLIDGTLTSNLKKLEKNLLSDNAVVA